MGLLDKIRSFLKPLPQQQVMDRGEKLEDPNDDPRNPLRDPGATQPKPSLEDDVRPPLD